MEERIFIEREKVDYKPVIFIVVSALLIIVGVVGILSNIDSTPPSKETKQEDNSLSNTTPEASNREPIAENIIEKPEPIESPKKIEEEVVVITQINKPENDAEIYVYFPSANTNLIVNKVIRTKPEKNIESFVLNQFFAGPTNEDLVIDKDLSKNWNFTNEKLCEKDIFYSFRRTGNNFAITLCRKLNVSNYNSFKLALYNSLFLATNIQSVNLVYPDGTCAIEGATDCKIN